ncbi:MAG TPA: benzoyl-CoA 2,3-epoxidase subunit BoxB [Candidatus Binataceae bacterium]|nr:benzoyl-CoA 2,3-epoxidase subunit BoxB [Candidatus Binataceae bacterium]
MINEIPNNVDLDHDPQLKRALSLWHPGFLKWWNEVGPDGFQQSQVYLRTAISASADGWARYGYVAMPEYQWGIFLAPQQRQKIGFGDHPDQDCWQQVPGEFRKELRRIIVTQGDTEPASVEQQRHLGRTAPSLYDLRNLFQINVEEARHLWAMVYLLHRYFGRDGREEADELLQRRSGHLDHPRILNAFNSPIRDWIDLFCFAMFTDRDGKYQLESLSESGFTPLARTAQFMLTEEAFHMFVGESGIQRIVQRTADLIRESGASDIHHLGGIDLSMLQKYINLWYTESLDLFGGEDSSNAATYFAAGLKGRYHEASAQGEHSALNGSYSLRQADGSVDEIPIRRAMNALLRDSYTEDCERALARWNRELQKRSVDLRLTLPALQFNRKVGAFAGQTCDPQGKVLEADEYAQRRSDWLPTEQDRARVSELLQPVHAPGKIAGWIAPPARSVNHQPFDFEYVLIN